MDFLSNLDIDWKTYVLIIIIILFTVIMTRIISWLFNKYITKASEKLKIDPTRYKFFKNATAVILWGFSFAAIVSLIPPLQTIAFSLFAGAGILVAVIGFAAQQAFSNIINGIFIVISKPFRVGDMIKVGSLQYGIVEDITLRHTVIKNFENKRIIVPNTVIGSETILNDSIEESKVCRWIEIGISYDSDVDLAIRIIQEECVKHELCIDVRTQTEIDEGIPQVIVRLLSFGDFSVNLKAYAWTGDPLLAFQMHCDINKSMKERFDAEGIEIPFPYRTIVYKNDLKKEK